MSHTPSLAPPLHGRLLLTVIDGHIVKSEAVENDAFVTSYAKIKEAMQSRGHAVIPLPLFRRLMQPTGPQKTTRPTRKHRKARAKCVKSR